MAFTLKAKGLYTFTNELSVPEGSLKVADNIVIDEDGVIESRRGFKTYGTSVPSGYIKQLLTYKDRLFRHYSNVLQYDDGSGNFSSFSGNYTEIVAGLRTKYVELNGNFYFTTNEGVKKISATSSSEFTTASNYITQAGGIKSLDFLMSLVGTTGYLSPGEQVAYRTVWGTKDKNNNLILGSPSPRFVIDNTTVNQVNVQLSIQTPTTVTTDYFIQLYRTAKVTPSTPGADEAGDEMNLVDERPWDGTTLFVIVDETIEEFRAGGTPLYTNAISGQGILQANDRPPIAQDLAFFRGSLFYSNTKTYHRKEINLLSAIGLNGYSFTLGNSSVVRTYVFQNYDSTTQSNPSIVVPLTGGIVGVDTGGTPAQNVDTTARNLVRIINQDTNSPVYCYYISTDATLPGLIVFENTTLADIKTYFSVNNTAIKNKFNPEMFIIPSPTISNISTSNIYSDNEVSKNRVYYSKQQQPEAVPTLNYIDVGPKDKQIHRILALRDNLFVLKEDGVYLITGSSAPNFTVRLLDGSTQISAPDSAAILSNKIFCLTSQGVVQITETGAQIISRPIENLIKAIATSDTTYEMSAFGVGYEKDRSYTLWLPSNSTDTVATQAYRYNTFTSTWTRWLKTNTCGIIAAADEKMYLGNGIHVQQERKNNERTDYADEEFDLGILEYGAIQENDLLVNTVSNISIGDAVYQKQYISISFFNRILRKLDLDVGLANSLAGGGTGYLSALKMNNGDDLLIKLISLDAKLQTDINIGTYVPVSFSGDFIANQIQFNILITQLNNPVTGTLYKNYPLSVGSIYFETLVLGMVKSQNRLNLVTQLPFIYGLLNPLTVFKAIPIEVVSAPQHFGAVDQLKQISETTLIFDQNNFYGAKIEFQTDLSRNFDEVDFLGRGSGVYGFQVWSEFFWGGKGSDVPFRTFVPKEKQRCRYITCKFIHGNARNKFRLLGISFEPRVVSTRAYR